MNKVCTRCKKSYLIKELEPLEFKGWQETIGLGLAGDRLALFNCPCNGTMAVWEHDLDFKPQIKNNKAVA